MRWKTTTNDNFLMQVLFVSFGIETTAPHGPLLFYTSIFYLFICQHFFPHTKPVFSFHDPQIHLSLSRNSVPGASDRGVWFSAVKLTQEVVHCFESLLAEAPQRPSRAGEFPRCEASAVFDEPVDVMLSSVLAGGHLEDVGYAQEGFQCVPVRHHL